MIELAILESRMPQVEILQFIAVADKRNYLIRQGDISAIEMGDITLRIQLAFGT